MAKEKKLQKFTVIKGFTLDRFYHRGETFMCDNAKLILNLQTSKLIK